MGTERSTSRRRGSTLIEILIALTLFTVVLLASMAMIDSGRQLSVKTLEVTTVEDLSQQMIYGIERELGNSYGAEPRGFLGAGATAGQATLVGDSTIGFPPTGFLLLEPGTASEERVRYGALDPDRITFLGLTRGAQATTATAHPFQAEFIWSGLAEPIGNQINPQPSDYEGIALEASGQVYFRGDGTGFSYRVPIDPTGGTNYVNGNDLNWGAEIWGAPTLDGWNAIYYAPRLTVSEQGVREDLNGDGDTADVFDVGQLRRVRWDTTNPNLQEERGLGPTAVLQERDAWGSDLDADGFEDPLFLWDKQTNELHLRLFVLGSSKKEIPIVRKVESVMFLRNEPEL